MRHVYETQTNKHIIPIIKKPYLHRMRQLLILTTNVRNVCELSVRKYHGSTFSKEISNKIGGVQHGGVQRPGQTYSESVVEVPVKDSEASLVDSLTSIPQSLGTLAVSAIKFITPKKPAVDRISSIPSGGRPPSATVSEVRPLIDLEDPSTLALGVAGVAAITGVTYAITNALDSENASVDEDDAESKQVPNNFERFGAEHFLTNFASKRSFD